MPQNAIALSDCLLQLWCDDHQETKNPRLATTLRFPSGPARSYLGDIRAPAAVANFTQPLIYQGIRDMTMSQPESIIRELHAAYDELQAIRRKMADLNKQLCGETVKEYTLKDRDNKPVTLPSLFGDKDDLIIVHNMGRKCVYCTLWADGFNGVWQHLADRAAFAVVSYDDPATMKEFAASRDWRFQILSNDGTSFALDMGFADSSGNPHPGMSTFHRESDGTITRVARAPFGPGDDFCAVWHMFDLLQDGVKGWEPKYTYS